MFEIKVISTQIYDLPKECECGGYAGSANNIDQPSNPIDQLEKML